MADSLSLSALPERLARAGHPRLLDKGASDVADELSDPVAGPLLASLAEIEPGMTLGELLREPAAEAHVLRRGPGWQERLSEVLLGWATQQARGVRQRVTRSMLDHPAKTKAKRKRKRPQPKDEAAKRLEARLATLEQELDRDPQAERALVHHEAEISIESTPPAVDARFVGGARTQAPLLVRLVLAGFEHANVEFEDSAGAAYRRCVVEWLRDALVDPKDELHDALRELIAVPTWHRLRDALGEITAQPSSRTQVRTELVFRLERDHRHALGLKPLLRTEPAQGPAKTRAVEPTEVPADAVNVRSEGILCALILADAARRRGDEDAARENMEAAFAHLPGHPAVFVEGNRVPLSVCAVEPELALVAGGAGGLVPDFRVAGTTLTLTDMLRDRIGRERFVSLERSAGRVLVGRLHETGWAVAMLLDRYRARIPVEGSEGQALLKTLLAASDRMTIRLPASLRGARSETDPGSRLRIEPEGEGVRASLVVQPTPWAAPRVPGTGPRVIHRSSDDDRPATEQQQGDTAPKASALEWAERDLALEEVRGQETARGLQLEASPTTPWSWRIASRADTVALLGRAEAHGIHVQWPEDAKAWRTTTLGSADLRVNVAQSQDWFRLGGEAWSEEERIELEALLDAVREGRSYVELAPDRFALLDEGLVRQLQELDDASFVQRRKRVVAPALAERVASLLEGQAVESDAAWERCVSKLRQAATSDPEVPERLKTELRGYQKDGFKWLARRAEQGLGACLADDMGLGKTVQALAVMLRRAPLGPQLVVAPTSVIEVWREEAARFAPDLKVRIYRGPNRGPLLHDLEPFHLVLASYEVLALDIDRLGAQPFATLVLDESQRIKNSRTQRARAARSIQAEFRLALSGTPIENHLGELYSLFQVLNPGMLGSWERFRERFALPIERDQDPKRREALRGLIQPFLLRRTKSQVAPELPARTEVVRPVELDESERKLYDAHRLAALRELESRGGQNERRFSVLAAITRLRLLACHPRLVDASWNKGAAKLNAFLEILDDLNAQKQRALVFSQFTTHLALVREALEERRQPYLYLDGSTPGVERGRLVRTWAEGEQSLFLISLKAGGAGLNLSGADTVIHMDPWWNPAVEDQASDRTHRIGQTRPVTVVRLIASQTIEDSVLALHDRKRDLVDGLLSGLKESSTLSNDELLELLQAG